MHRRLRSWLLGLLPTIALLLAVPGAAAAAPRLALVIGDAAYPARPLATAANDAALVAQALAQSGFDVTAAHDLDAAGTRAVFAAFADAARAAGADATILVYLAGHGVQYDNDNYLVPVDARLVHDDDVPREAASLDELSRTLAAILAKTRLLVYDLARTSTFATADEMPLADGLALTVAPSGTLVAFNAAPGMAAPQAAPPYGAYARALAEMIGTPDLSPGTLFERVRLRVGELTDGTQVPWDEGTVGPEPLSGAGRDPPAGTARSIDAIPVDALSPDVAYSAVVARDSLAGYAEFLRAFPAGPLSTRVRMLLGIRREALIWQAATQAGDPRALWTYMRRYPRGPHWFDARRRLAALHAPLEPPPRFDIVVFPNLGAPSPEELKLVTAPLAAMHDLPPIPPPPDALLQPADADYYDALPPPAPAPAGLLPIAAPLPQAEGRTGDGGRITQDLSGKGPVVTETDLAQDGATLTLADAMGAIAEVAVKTAADGARTILETDARKAVLSKTTTLRSADGLAMVQTGATGGVLYGIATRTDPDGARVTRVTGGRGELLATWRRDPQGIVVEHDDAATVHGGVKTETPAAHRHAPPVPAVHEPAAQPSPPGIPPTTGRPSGPPAVAVESRTRLAPSASPTAPTAPAQPKPAQPALSQPRLASPTVVPVRPPSPSASQPGAPAAPPPSPKTPAERPEIAPRPKVAPAPPLPPHRPTTDGKPKPSHASAPAHAPAPKHAPRAPEPKHAPAQRKPASHAGKPKAEPAHRKAARR